MDNSELSVSDPFFKRFYAYLKERFPLAGHGILILSYYSSNQFLAHVLTDPGEQMHYSLNSFMGGIILFLFFFHLRVFDEHKDYEEDSRHYPDRILQRGVITLKHLRVAGAGAIVIELILAACIGIPALLALVMAQVFSFLMLKEFFIGGWLKQHFLLYAISHMLVMPLLAMIVYSIATGEFLWHAPAWFWFYAFVGFFVTFNWEISRKIRAPEDEIDGVDTYTRIFGTYGAAYAVLLVRVVDTGMVALVGWHLGLSWLFYTVLILLFCVCLTGFFQYRYNTCRKTASRMETYAGMYIIAFDLTLAVEIARHYGLSIPI